MDDPAHQLESSPARTTQLIRKLGRGEAGAEDELWPIVYSELRRIARHKMARRGPGQTLQTTALVHEAWIRLAGGGTATFQDRVHFFRVASRIMRAVLVDRARARNAAKRGGARTRVTFEDALCSVEGDSDLFLMLDEGLKRLGTQDPQLERIAELRCFAGLSHNEIAESLAVSTRTVERGWRMARAWLQRELDHGSE